MPVDDGKTAPDWSLGIPSADLVQGKPLLGKLAAQNMLVPKQRLAIVPFFWSQHYDVTLRYVGHAEHWDEVRVEGDLDARDARIEYLAAGKCLAVATSNRDRESLAAELAFERQLAAATAQ